MGAIPGSRRHPGGGGGGSALAGSVGGDPEPEELFCVPLASRRPAAAAAPHVAAGGKARNPSEAPCSVPSRFGISHKRNGGHRIRVVPFIFQCPPVRFFQLTPPPSPAAPGEARPHG